MAQDRYSTEHNAEYRKQLQTNLDRILKENLQTGIYGKGQLDFEVQDGSIRVFNLGFIKREMLVKQLSK